MIIGLFGAHCTAVFESFLCIVLCVLMLLQRFQVNARFLTEAAQERIVKVDCLLMLGH